MPNCPKHGAYYPDYPGCPECRAEYREAYEEEHALRLAAGARVAELEGVIGDLLYAADGVRDGDFDRKGDVLAGAIREARAALNRGENDDV